MKVSTPISVALLLLPSFSIVGLDQPVAIPGNYVLVDQHFPPIADIINKKSRHFPVYGVDTWMSEYKILRKHIQSVGWSRVRIGGPLSDADINMLYDDGTTLRL